MGSSEQRVSLMYGMKQDEGQKNEMCCFGGTNRWACGDKERTSGEGCEKTSEGGDSRARSAKETRVLGRRIRVYCLALGFTCDEIPVLTGNLHEGMERTSERV